MRILRASQRGNSIAEVLVSTAIAGLLMGALVPSIPQLFNAIEKRNDSLTAMFDMQNAIRWISRDGQGAQTTNLVAGAVPVGQLTLTWTEWDGVTETGHSSSYSLSGSELKRNYDGNVTTVAQYITSIKFSLENSVIKVEMTSSPENNNLGLSKQATYYVTLRPA